MSNTLPLFVAEALEKVDRSSSNSQDSEDLDSTEVDDLFALGTVIYEICVGHQVYAHRSSREIRKLLHQQEFPNLESVVADIRAVIGKCWLNGYQTAEEVVCDLRLTQEATFIAEEINR
jgi:hypothetical protein